MKNPLFFFDGFFPAMPVLKQVPRKKYVTTTDGQKHPPHLWALNFHFGRFFTLWTQIFSCFKSFFLDNIIGNQTLKFAIPGGAGPVCITNYCPPLSFGSENIGTKARGCACEPKFRVTRLRANLYYQNQGYYANLYHL